MKTVPRPEYPRPQFIRQNWLCLNGEWQFEIGTPTDIGLWIKGDSCWGKLVFEIEDANKVVWRTEGTWHDWPGDLSVNFDGWRFLRYPIDGSSTERNLSPSDRWNGGKGDPVFPIRLRGLYVVVNRQALDPT